MFTASGRTMSLHALLELLDFFSCLRTQTPHYTASIVEQAGCRKHMICYKMLAFCFISHTVQDRRPTGVMEQMCVF